MDQETVVSLQPGDVVHTPKHWVDGDQNLTIESISSTRVTFRRADASLCHDSASPEDMFRCTLVRRAAPLPVAAGDWVASLPIGARLTTFVGGTAWVVRAVNAPSEIVVLSRDDWDTVSLSFASVRNQFEPVAPLPVRIPAQPRVDPDRDELTTLRAELALVRRERDVALARIAASSAREQKACAERNDTARENADLRAINGALTGSVLPETKPSVGFDIQDASEV